MCHTMFYNVLCSKFSCFSHWILDRCFIEFVKHQEIFTCSQPTMSCHLSARVDQNTSLHLQIGHKYLLVCFVSEQFLQCTKLTSQSMYQMIYSYTSKSSRISPDRWLMGCKVKSDNHNLGYFGQLEF